MTMSLHRPQFPPLCLLIVLVLTSFVAGDYYIDDTNSTVVYSVSASASGSAWNAYGVGVGKTVMFETGTANITVDASKCYDETYQQLTVDSSLSSFSTQAAKANCSKVAGCMTSDDCQIQIPFTGSGVTIYILNAGSQGVGASLAVDGGQAVTTTIAAPSAPSYQTPNISLFSVQSLPYGSHSAVLSVLDWNNGITGFYFDYALVNENYVAPPPSPSQTPISSVVPVLPISGSLPTSSPSSSTASNSPISVLTIVSSTSTPTTNTAAISTTYTPGASQPPTTATSPQSPTTVPSHSSLNLGVVIGSSCGGLAAIAALLATFIFLKKRKARLARLDDAHRPAPFPPTSPNATPSPPSPPQMDEKARLRLARLYAPFTRDDGDFNDFRFPPSADSAVMVVADRPSVAAHSEPYTDAESLQDMVIDVTRQQNGPLSAYTGFGSDHARSMTTTTYLPPPSYQTD
ncbi:hypothetical protein HYDPIDRAFT_168522 [Hydnomerulius pinastri MD-312]|uniref:Membrane-associated protein n=1 Tax=Hydnomerulius pinastri MD-312 TaxID=994086 RepID=A0A0C9VCG7_9AGAM|nr:hypothetical protein HYDPIDRAFT_168522 [Hydnomerulius pinastri MD-312]